MNKIKDLYSLTENLPPDALPWSLVDAFDAVTNGLENPESFIKMESLKDPALEPWKNLVLAIKALYDADFPACKKACEALDESSAPGVLKPFFRAWMIRQQSGPVRPGTETRETIFGELIHSPGPVAELYRRILIEPHPLTLLAGQAEEALRHELPEQFIFLAGRVLEGLQVQGAGNGPLLAVRYAVYCLDLLDKAGYGGDDFFPIILKTLGVPDGFCALGLALIGRDNEAAAGALGKALEGEGGKFLDEDMRAVLEETLAILGGQVREKKRPPSGPPPSGKKKKAGPLHKGRQLELFGENLYG
jgi:hypothetical protein